MRTINIALVVVYAIQLWTLANCHGKDFKGRGGHLGEESEIWSEIAERNIGGFKRSDHEGSSFFEKRDKGKGGIENLSESSLGIIKNFSPQPYDQEDNFDEKFGSSGSKWGNGRKSGYNIYRDSSKRRKNRKGSWQSGLGEGYSTGLYDLGTDFGENKHGRRDKLHKEEARDSLRGKESFGEGIKPSHSLNVNKDSGSEALAIANAASGIPRSGASAAAEADSKGDSAGASALASVLSDSSSKTGSSFLSRLKSPGKKDSRHGFSGNLSKLGAGASTAADANINGNLAVASALASALSKSSSKTRSNFSSQKESHNGLFDIGSSTTGASADADAKANLLSNIGDSAGKTALTSVMSGSSSKTGSGNLSWLKSYGKKELDDKIIGKGALGDSKGTLGAAAEAVASASGGSGALAEASALAKATSPGVNGALGSSSSQVEVLPSVSFGSESVAKAASEAVSQSGPSITTQALGDAKGTLGAAAEAVASSSGGSGALAEASALAKATSPGVNGALGSSSSQVEVLPSVSFGSGAAAEAAAEAVSQSGPSITTRALGDAKGTLGAAAEAVASASGGSGALAEASALAKTTSPGVNEAASEAVSQSGPSITTNISI